MPPPLQTDNIAVGVCEEAAKAGYHAPEDFLIPGVCCLCIQQCIILMIEICSVLRVQEHILTVRQSLNIQI